MRCTALTATATAVAAAALLARQAIRNTPAAPALQPVTSDQLRALAALLDAGDERATALVGDGELELALDHTSRSPR